MSFSFALFVLSLLVSGKLCHANDDCVSDAAKPALSELLRVFESPVQNDNVGTADENCAETASQIRMIEAKFELLESRIAALDANNRLRSTLTEARQTFDAVRIVYNRLKDYWQLSERSTRRNAKRECNNQHPINALIRIESQAKGHSPLFMEIVSGSRYSESIFNETTSVLITESAVAAILAMECDKLLHPDASSKAHIMWDSKIKQKLNIIKEKMETASRHLRDGYHKAVKGEIRVALDDIDKMRIDRRSGGQYIYQLLNSTYPFRAWAVMIYKHLPSGAYAAHAHEGTHDNWFLVDNGVHTVVAHGSDRSANCNEFADRIRGKKLQDIIGDKVAYRDIVAGQVGNLGSIIDLLRSTLRDEHQLPDNHFISIVAYRSDLSVTREHDYHFFEHLRDLGTEQKPTRTVLIGWC